MQCINSSFYSKCSIEEPCAGKLQARFCGGCHGNDRLINKLREN